MKKEILKIGRMAKEASSILSRVSTNSKNQALRNSADIIISSKDKILKSNSLDIKNAEKNKLSEAMIDRLVLNHERIEAIASSLNKISDFDDPIGKIISETERPNGLVIQRVKVPLGVIGIIYESRPNVTADAGGLCLKSGNAVILRGGTEAVNSNKIIHSCLIDGLEKAGLPSASIQMIPTQDREAVGVLLRDMTEYVDIIIPRGGKNLIARIQEDARVPVIGHLEGICHTYVHKHADLNMAKDIILNAKMRRTGICGATETILIDSVIANDFLPPILDTLIRAGCEIKGSKEVVSIDNRANKAEDSDWGKEFLDAVVAIRLVDDIEEALDYIRKYGSGHTEAIISSNQDAADKFLAELDSSIVMHNTSTQFADGGEFGMGAEIGIATGRIHARGPVGSEQLTSYKYIVRGEGQIRP
jgi:glutamate-5-semialdehyde dehydrogenase|tara:strand:+ start:9532 stop:10785 length:1254 start_codon:yes stop_codon:yes gene_type:complete